MSDNNNPYSVDFDDSIETIERPDGKKVEMATLGNDGNVYAGSYPRYLMEGAENDPEHIWFGYDETTGYPVGIPVEDFRQHLALMGATGVGKSTLYKNILVQIALKGGGFCYIDPKGEDVDELVEMLPEHRLDDVIYIDPVQRDANYDELVGFNLLEVESSPGDPSFEADVEAMKDQVKDFLRTGGEGIRFNTVLDTMLLTMGSFDEHYTILDLYEILADQEQQEAYLEKIRNADEQWAREAYAQNIVEELDEGDLDAVVNRLKTVVESNLQRPFVSFEESTVSIEDALNEDAIVLVKNSEENLQESVARFFIRKFWRAAQKRAEKTPESELDPYFLFIDEAAQVVDADMGVQEILAKARSKYLSLSLGMQFPGQLPKSVTEELFSNAKTRVVMRTQEDQNARIATQGMKTAEGEKVKKTYAMGKNELPDYYSISETSDHGVVKIKHFADLPPRRSEEQAKNVIKQSIRRHGEVAPVSRHDIKTHLPADKKQREEREENIKQALAYAVGIGQRYVSDDYSNPDPAPEDLVDDLLPLFTSEDSDYALDNIVESNAEFRLQKTANGKTGVSLTPQGEALFETQESGTAGSGAKKKHRLLLSRARDDLAQLGVAVDVPEQGGDDELADGHGYIFADSDSPITRDHEEMVPLEAETSTHEDKPAQTFNNLDKAIRNPDIDTPVVFIVEEGSDSSDFDHNAELIETLFDGSRNRTKGHWTKLYSANKKLGGDEATPVRPLNGGSRTNEWWRHDETGEIILTSRGDLTKKTAQTGNYDAIATFETTDDFENYRISEDFPAYVKQERGKWVVKQDGETIEEYTTKSEFKEEWVEITKPYIPEVETKRAITRDDYEIVIFPHDHDDEPVIYRDGDLYDLHGQPLFPDSNDTPSEDETNDDTQSTTEPEETLTEPDEPADDQLTDDEEDDDTNRFLN